jgi:hypothetical protein
MKIHTLPIFRGQPPPPVAPKAAPLSPAGGGPSSSSSSSAGPPAATTSHHRHFQQPQPKAMAAAEALEQPQKLQQKLPLQKSLQKPQQQRSAAAIDSIVASSAVRVRPNQLMMVEQRQPQNQQQNLNANDGEARVGDEREELRWKEASNLAFVKSKIVKRSQLVLLLFTDYNQSQLLNCC